MKLAIKKNKLEIIVFFILGVIPFFLDSYYLNNISYFMCWSFISLGLAVIWGDGGSSKFWPDSLFWIGWIFFFCNQY